MKYFPYNEITVEQILTFINVAKTLNMTKSAEELSVTQSAISKRISALEEATGVILFTKHKKVMKLTPAGEFLNKRLKKEYDNIREAFDTAREIQQNGRPKFSIGVCMTFDTDQMRELVEEFKNIYPDTEVDIDVWVGEGIVNKLSAGELDVLFIHTVHIQHLADVEYFNFTRAHLFMAASSEKDPEDVLSGGLALYIQHADEVSVLAGDILAQPGIVKNKINYVNSSQAVYYNMIFNNRATITGYTQTSGWLDDEKIAVYPTDISYDICLCRKSEPNEYVDTFIKIFRKKMNDEHFRFRMDESQGIHLHEKLTGKQN